MRREKGQTVLSRSARFKESALSIYGEPVGELLPVRDDPFRIVTTGLGSIAGQQYLSLLIYGPFASLEQPAPDDL